MENDVHARVDVEVAGLEGSGEGEDQGDVVLRYGGRRRDGRGTGGGQEWVGRDAAGQRSVVVDVELQ